MASDPRRSWSIVAVEREIVVALATNEIQFSEGLAELEVAGRIASYNRTGGMPARHW